MIGDKILFSNFIQFMIDLFYRKDKSGNTLSKNIFYKKNFIDEMTLQKITMEVIPILNKAKRIKVKDFKKGEAISFKIINEHCPTIINLYNELEKISCYQDFLGDKRKWYTCPKTDLHRCALYIYNETGDFVNWHFDTSFYKGSRFTVLIGIEDNSSAMLETESEYGNIKIGRGDCVVFDGNKIRHRVTPIKKEERRIILTFEYLTNTKFSVFGNLITKIKDQKLYFGKE